MGPKESHDPRHEGADPGVEALLSSRLASARPKPAGMLTKPVFLIGFMGAGKSSVARKLARRCGVASVDMDKYIERKAGCSIASIFERSGEEGFRALETEVLRELAEDDYPMLISCGGGVVVRPENVDILKGNGYVVHLEVDADEASSRISDKSSRPLFSDVEAARARLEARMPLYDAASHASISTNGKNVSQIANEVQSLLEQEGVLCQQRR